MLRTNIKILTTLLFLFLFTELFSHITLFELEMAFSFSKKISIYSIQFVIHSLYS